ncbi:thermonuclease family protein [Mesorhizobium sp. ASY16-5R]|uniref:thermonuclease family protein n=1 Tax=Mesorhizobium sp. ASY16-5R TaxID=3445772 RepID=UPI003F9EC5EF
MLHFNRQLITSVIAAGLAAAPQSALAETRIMDGATLVIDGKTFRLWGIEAPAPGRMCPASNGIDWPCGDRARDQLAAVAGEDEITCEPKGNGVAICRAAGLDLGMLMVKEGLAWSRGGYDAVEEQARAAKVGIWE